jgi:hypothetical protein
MTPGLARAVAADLAMHMLGLSFVDAVKRLTEPAGSLGPDHP